MLNRHRKPDPIKFGKLCWPDVEFYDKEVEIIYSVEDNVETFVPAANMMGKDFVAAFCCVYNALCNEQFRIVTTSVDDKHLTTLWGEIERFVHTSKVPLVCPNGPLICNHRFIRKVVRGEVCRISYLMGRVADAEAQGLAGHHAPYTLAVGDEASGMKDQQYTQMMTWAKRALFFGNCNPCNNFFRRACEAGDKPLPDLLTNVQPDFVVR